MESKDWLPRAAAASRSATKAAVPSSDPACWLPAAGCRSFAAREVMTAAGYALTSESSCVWGFDCAG